MSSILSFLSLGTSGIMPRISTDARLWLVLLLLPSLPARSDLDAGRRSYEQGNYATSLKELTPLAEQGNSEAQVLIGQMYSRGQGVPLDFAKAIKWFKAAAEQGNSDGQLHLGLAYLKGVGVEKDVAQALKWLKLSANQGNVVAQLDLGLAFRNLSSIPHDYVEAWMWFELAARQGDPLAPKQRDSLQRFMTRQQVEQARVRAAAWNPVISSAHSAAR
jgi:uncharacterized protein